MHVEKMPKIWSSQFFILLNSNSIYSWCSHDWYGIILWLHLIINRCWPVPFHLSKCPSHQALRWRTDSIFSLSWEELSCTLFVATCGVLHLFPISVKLAADLHLIFVRQHLLYKTPSDLLSIVFLEIFTYLALKVKTTPTIEGDPITLSCEAALNSALDPLRGSTTLKFTFYKDGNKLREFGNVNTYEIKMAMKTDSGNYTCSVKNPVTDGVKISQELEINVEGKNKWGLPVW